MRILQTSLYFRRGRGAGALFCSLFGCDKRERMNFVYGDDRMLSDFGD